MKLRLLHVHMPDGTVSSPMPIGRVLEMLEDGVITKDTQICESGTQEWTPLRYEDSVMRPIARSEPPPRYQYQPEEDNLSARLNRAALIFAALGVVGGIFASAAFGANWFFAGLSGPAAVAIVTAVIAHVMRGRQI